MRENKVKVISRTGSPFENEGVKDSLSFFKLQTPSHVDRRKVRDRRSHHRQEFIGHIPERRKNMVGRRKIKDRRGMLSRSYEYVVGKSITVYN